MIRSPKSEFELPVLYVCVGNSCGVNKGLKMWNTHGGQLGGVVGVGVAVGGEVPPLDVQLTQLADDARVAHNHHRPREHQSQV